MSGKSNRRTLKIPFITWDGKREVGKGKKRLESPSLSTYVTLSKLQTFDTVKFFHRSFCWEKGGKEAGEKTQA